MVIINADDWGRSPEETGAALACCKRGSVTSVSAMVFMSDSVRAARVAAEHGIDVGLHLNFSESFSASGTNPELLRVQGRLAGYLRRNRITQLIYHPFLGRDFATSFGAQLQEFHRLYGAPPSHIDGHHHMHLCANMLVSGLIPTGTKVRRSFSFWPGEKSLPNRLYRAAVDRWLMRRYRVPDYFFCLLQSLKRGTLPRAISLGSSAHVELMTHPLVKDEQDFLLSDAFQAQFGSTRLGTYAQL